MNLLERELRIAWRTRSETAAHMVFTLLITTLFPFVIGPNETQLEQLAPGLLLFALLLGQLLGFERLFVTDFTSGTLDVINNASMPLARYALVKSIAQWAALFLPVLILSPVLMLLLHVSLQTMPYILAALALASLLIQLLGMLGASLALGAKSAGLLLPLLLIPFYIPVIILSTTFASQGFTGEGVQALLFLAALFFLYLLTLPFLSGAALRSALESA
jgi:heme exporter protein B